MNRTLEHGLTKALRLAAVATLTLTLIGVASPAIAAGPHGHADLAKVSKRSLKKARRGKSSAKKAPSKKELKRRRTLHMAQYFYLTEKNYKQAAKLYTSAFKMDKSKATVGIMAARARVKLGDNKGARKVLSAVAKANKTSSVAWLALGQHQREMGSVDKAIKSYRKALAIQPKNADAHREMYNIFLARANKGEKKALLPLVTHLKGYVAYTRYTRGAHYRRAERLLAKFEGGDLGLTIFDGKRAYRDAWNSRGGINRRMAAAHKSFEKCLRMKPTAQVCHFYMGLIKNSIKSSKFHNVAAAKASFKKAPLFVHAWVELGIILRREDDTAGAEKAFKQSIAVSKRPADGQRAHLELGILYKLDGQDQKAVALFEKAYKLRRHSSLASRSLNELASVNPEHSLVLAAFRFGKLKGTIFSTEKYKGAMKALERRFKGVDPKAPEKAVLDQILARIVEHADIPADNKLNVQVLNSKIVNAFAAPNGNIYFTKGFFKMVSKTWPGKKIDQHHDVIAHVMAHEITHVIRRHTLRSRVYKEAARDANSMISPNVVTHVTRLHEIEADREGIVLAFLAGYHPRGGIEFMEAQGKVREIPKHLSHPTFDERIHFLEEYWSNDVKYAWMSFKFGLDAMAAAKKAEASGDDKTAVKSYQTAVAHFQRFKATLKSQKEVGNNLGIGYAKLGILQLASSESALNRWQTSFSVEKSLALSYVNLKGKRRTRGMEARKVTIPAELKKARRIFQQSVRKFPKYGRAKFNLAVVHVAIGDYDKAQAALASATGVSGPELAIMRGVVAAEKKDFSKAIAQFKLANTGETARAAAYNTAYALALSGKKPQAKAAYQAYVAKYAVGSWTDAAKLAITKL